MMVKDLVYSKHNITQSCGVAYFSGILANKLSGIHVHGFNENVKIFISIWIFENLMKTILVVS